jgi:hypothetical protein
MQKNFFSFLIRLLLFTVILYFIYHFIKSYIPPRFSFQQSICLFIFFFFITAVFHFGLVRSAAKSGRGFVSYYMTATAFKLFIYIGIIITYALLNRGRAIGFISHFFILYIFYTVFEVSVAYGLFKNNPSAIEENNSITEGLNDGA